MNWRKTNLTFAPTPYTSFLKICSLSGPLWTLSHVSSQQNEPIESDFFPIASRPEKCSPNDMVPKEILEEKLVKTILSHIAENLKCSSFLNQGDFIALSSNVFPQIEQNLAENETEVSATRLQRKDEGWPREAVMFNQWLNLVNEINSESATSELPLSSISQFPSYAKLNLSTICEKKLYVSIDPWKHQLIWLVFEDFTEADSHHHTA